MAVVWVLSLDQDSSANNVRTLTFVKDAFMPNVITNTRSIGLRSLLRQQFLPEDQAEKGIEIQQAHAQDWNLHPPC